MKTYQFDFNATQRGYGVVYADNVEESKRKILEGDYEDIIDTYDMEITEITNIEEIEDD